MQGQVWDIFKISTISYFIYTLLETLSESDVKKELPWKVITFSHSANAMFIKMHVF